MSDYNSVPPFTVCDQDLSDLDLELSLEIYFKEVKALFYEITRLCLAYIVLLCTICTTVYYMYYCVLYVLLCKHSVFDKPMTNI